MVLGVWVASLKKAKKHDTSQHAPSGIPIHHPTTHHLNLISLTYRSENSQSGVQKNQVALAFVSFAAMSCEVEFKTLHGGVMTLEAMMETTLGELKTMLLDKHLRAEDPIERKLLRVELLRNSSIMEMEDGQTLGATGLLEAEAPTTVIYRRNEAEASTKDDVHALGFFHLNIPSNCTTISRSAFDSCQNLVSVTITESVTHIGDYAFSHCTSLASVTLGDSVIHIGNCAFHGCTCLASIILGESVTQISRCAFEKCTSLAFITFGESLTHIGEGTFQGCSSLASITVGKSVTHIGEWAFHGCTSLTSITLGESVTHIREWAFADCTSLTSITLGNGVEYIGAGAFARCTSLASVYLGESVPHISRFAFENCTSLANITMCPELMENIQQDAFEGCVSLAIFPSVWGFQRRKGQEPKGGTPFCQLELWGLYKWSKIQELFHCHL